MLKMMPVSRKEGIVSKRELQQEGGLNVVSNTASVDAIASLTLNYATLVPNSHQHKQNTGMQLTKSPFKK